MSDKGAHQARRQGVPCPEDTPAVFKGSAVDFRQEFIEIDISTTVSVGLSSILGSGSAFNRRNPRTGTQNLVRCTPCHA